MRLYFFHLLSCSGEEVGGEYKRLYKKHREQFNWMNDELNTLIKQELERRLKEHEEDKAKLAK